MPANFLHRARAFSANSFQYQSILRTSLALAIALPLLAACGKAGPDAAAGKGPAGAMPMPEVNVVKIDAKNQPHQIEYAGQTAGSRETEVRARVSGILEQRLYEEGSRVNAGTVLFQIDPGTYRTQVASGEAALAVAQARLNQSLRELSRLTPLAQEKAISQKEFDDSKSAFEIAQANLKQVQAQLNEAKLNLAYTKVLAPISGVTGVAVKSNGNMLSSADNLLTTIVQTDPMYVNFSLPEDDYLKLIKDVSSGTLTMSGKRAKNGSLPFEVTLKQADGSIFPATGKLNFASERINPATGGFDVRAQIPNPDGTLHPGQFVRVQLQGAQRASAISVPQRAVLDGPMGKMVFVVTPQNQLQPRPVELDGWSNGQWIVLKGLKNGEMVMVDGFIKAHNPGMTVKPVVISASATNAAPAAAAGSTASAPAASAAKH